MSNVLDLEQRRRFDEEVNISRSWRTWIGCILALVLWPAGIILDLAGHPDMFWPLVRCRLFCVTCVGIVAIWLWQSKFKLSHLHAIIASWIWGLAPAFAISWMVVITTGSQSPFYAGLNLVILGTCILMPFTGKESAIYCIAVYISYLLAIYAHSFTAKPTEFSGDYLTLHSTFIIMTATICVTFSHFSFKSRQQDFVLRETLRQQNEQLSNIDRTKTEFFANVSHELRTPMTLILAPLEQIMHERSSLPQPMQNTLALVQRNAHRLIHLIDDLLDLVRFERVREISKKETVDLPKLLRALTESFQWTAKQNGISLSFENDDLPGIVEGDIHQLERVFINLLSNAVKFTPANGIIRVNSKSKDDKTEIEVADSGTGIPADHIDKIFDRYYQSTSANSRAVQGLGIGLALVKQIVELHGGEVSVKSSIGQGSTFKVKLPLSTSPISSQVVNEPSDKLLKYSGQKFVETHLPSNSDFAQNIDRPLVLVLDDEEDMLVFLSDILRKKFNVVSFRSATDAKTWLSENQLAPEVIISDLMMPTIDGMSFAKWARGVRQLSNTRILMITARIDDAVKLEALNNGVDDFMTKPFSALELESRVSNLSANVQLQKGLAESNSQLERAYTQLKNAESQLIQSEKMNSLGTLSAGLLHEINNPLNHMMMAVNYCQNLVGQAGVGDRTVEVNETFSDITQSMKRIASIITDLREFAYPDTASAMSSFSLKRAVSSAIRFTRSETVGIKLIDLIPESVQVIGSEQQIVQVLINLLMNASYAVTKAYPGDGGIIRILSDLDNGGASTSIKIEDNGQGILPEHMERIFDPFFTTKPVGEGMGLGLSICHSILGRHNSSLKVLRTVDGFTSFQFSLEISGATQQSHSETGYVNA